ncbi:MAG TPA: PEP-CTERM sorting domain-containing protein [Fimbriimonadaceae bacterium]|nr:PEP-CTERM sorting domain-containing protein [Fimbriimonadaceae bacterium]
MRTVIGIGLLLLVTSAEAGVVGQWDFDGNFSGSIGGAVMPVAGTGSITFTTATIGGSTAEVAHVLPAATFTTGTDDPHFSAPNSAGGNGGGSFTNQYSIVMDVMIPSANSRSGGDGYTSLFQTNTSDTNDGDWFLRDDGGLGISGDYSDFGNPNFFTFGDWHRIALTIDTTSASGSATYRSYIDGALQNQVQSPSGWGVDGRYSLDTTFLLFADDDGEVNELYLNSLQLRDYAMTADEVAALGGPTAGGIPVPEPATFGVIGLGLAGLLARRRR